MNCTADIRSIVDATLAAAAPAPHVRRALAHAPELRRGHGIHLLALGKAAAAMTGAALAALETPPLTSLVIVPDGTPADLPCTTMHAPHPLPDERSVIAGRAIADMISRLPPGDTLLVLLSGGASSLAVLPAPGITIDAYADRVRRLMHDGADIRQLNAMRRTIDRLKGGGMARMTRHVRVLCLILSDVVGDPLDVIASGPLTDPDADHVRLEVIAGNRTALEAAAHRAAEIGYRVTVEEAPITGEARLAGAAFAQRAAALPPGSCLIAGGETTVTVRGSGRGGRNLEFALAACHAANATALTLCSCATDGVDGPTDAAGAIADEHTLSRAAALRLDPDAALAHNDSYTFFDRVGGLLRTGPTGTNVIDVHIALVSGETRPPHTA